MELEELERTYELIGFSIDHVWFVRLPAVPPRWYLIASDQDGVPASAYPPKRASPTPKFWSMMP